jgi:hypothetical protein
MSFPHQVLLSSNWPAIHGQPKADTSPFPVSPQGTLVLDGDDGAIHSLAQDGSVLGTRALTPTELHSVADIFSAAAASAEPPDNRNDGLGAGGDSQTCSPPISCVRNSVCPNECAGCTFVSWFPYGVCAPIRGMATLSTDGPAQAETGSG